MTTPSVPPAPPHRPPPPLHLDVMLALIEQGDVLTYLDGRVRGVILPDALRDRFRVPLRIGLNMPRPIQDLQFSEEGFSGTMSFGGVESWVFIPWAAVYAIVHVDTNYGTCWPSHVPVEEIMLALNTPVRVPAPRPAGKVINFLAARARLRPHAAPVVAPRPDGAA